MRSVKTEQSTVQITWRNRFSNAVWRCTGTMRFLREDSTNLPFMDMKKGFIKELAGLKETRVKIGWEVEFLFQEVQDTILKPWSNNSSGQLVHIYNLHAAIIKKENIDNSAIMKSRK